MARPERHDCDYFPFYAKDGRTLHILEGKYQCNGTGFFTNVMRFLTLQEDHHFCIADEADRMYFFSRCKCDEESGMDMLNIMAKTRKIHTSLWVSYMVITSPDLLKSLSDAYRNRKNQIITIEEIESIYSDLEVSDAGNSQADEFLTAETNKETDNQRQSYGKNPQTKLKETKLKNPAYADFFKNPFHPYFKSIEKSCITLSRLPPPKGKKPFNPFQFVNRKINKMNMHPGAVDYALKEMVKRYHEIDDLYGYGKSILKTANGNFCEKEHIDDHEQVKKDFAEYVNGSTELKAMIGKIGERI